MKHEPYIRHVPGSDTAVLMIHGIAGTPRRFAHLLPLIPDGWSVYNILLDGHGAGVKEFGNSSMKKWKAQVEAQLDRIEKDHKRVLIVAHSMGTLFAIEQAVQRPTLVAGLLLMNCPVRVKYPPSSMLLSLRAALGRSRDPGVLAMREDCSVALTPKLWQYLSWVPRFAELLREVSYVRELLPELTVSCLCFQSGKDELVRLSSCRDLAHNPAIRVEILKDSGHFAYSDRDLETIRRELDRMIRRLTASGSP